MLKQNRLNILFAALQAVYWIMYCIAISFIIPMLKDFGFSSLELGVAMTLMAVCCAAAQPLWGFLCDRFAKYRTIFLLSSLFATLAYFLLNVTRNKILITLLIMGVGATLQCMIGITDSWTSKFIQRGEPVNYGITRSAGSCCYALFAMLFGFITDRFGIRLSPWLLLLSVLLTLVIIALLPEPSATSARQTASFVKTAGAILRNKKFVVFTFCYFLMMLTLTSLNFYPVLLTELGGSGSSLGIAYFIMALCEMPAMIFYNRLKRRFGTLPLAAACMIFFCLKSVWISLSPNLGVAIGAVALQTVSYAIIVPALVDFISVEIPYQQAATALLILNTGGMTLSQIVGNLLNGFLVNEIGTRSLLLVMSFPSLVGGILLLIASRRYAKKRALPPPPCAPQ